MFAMFFKSVTAPEANPSELALYLESLVKTKVGQVGGVPSVRNSWFLVFVDSAFGCFGLIGGCFRVMVIRYK